MKEEEPPVGACMNVCMCVRACVCVCVDGVVKEKESMQHQEMT